MGAGDIPTLLDEGALADLHEDFASTGDLHELATLIRNFLANGVQQVAAIGEAVDRGDLEAVRQAGHKLGGSSRTLGAELLGAVAARAEEAGAAGDRAAARNALRQLEVVMSLTRGALSDMVDAIGGAQPGPAAGGVGTGAPPLAGAPLRALLADDEPVALAVLRAAVERLGHDCTVVIDGAAALDAYERERPHVVITGMEMPGIDGVELSRRIRARDAVTYIALLNAGGDRGAGALGESVDACLSKPLREDELRAVLALAAERVS